MSLGSADRSAVDFRRQPRTDNRNRPSLLAYPECPDLTGDVLDVGDVADDQRRRLDRLLAEPCARQELAVADRQPMHPAFEVADDDGVPLHGELADPAVLQ